MWCGFQVNCRTTILMPANMGMCTESSLVELGSLLCRKPPTIDTHNVAYRSTTKIPSQGLLMSATCTRSSSVALANLLRCDAPSIDMHDVACRSTTESPSQDLQTCAMCTRSSLVALASLLMSPAFEKTTSITESKDNLSRQGQAFTCMMLLTGQLQRVHLKACRCALRAQEAVWRLWPVC